MATNAIASQGTVFEIQTGTSTWAVISEVIDFSGFGGTTSIIDTTHMASTSKEKLAGTQDNGQVSLNFNYVSDDAGQLALAAAKASSAKTGFRMTLPTDNGNTITWDGFVISNSMSGGVDQKVSGSATIEVTGDVTITTVSGS